MATPTNPFKTQQALWDSLQQHCKLSQQHILSLTKKLADISQQNIQQAIQLLLTSLPEHETVLFNFFKQYWNLQDTITLKNTSELSMDPKKIAEIKISEKLRTQQLWIPVYQHNNQLVLAISNPQLCQLSQQLALQTGHNIHWLLLKHGNCQRLYHEVQAFACYKNYNNQFQGTDATHPANNMTKVSSASVATLIQAMIKHALLRQASDIHLEPSAEQINIRFRQHGLLQDITTIDTAYSTKITNYLKVKAGLDITQQRLPQDGHIRFPHSNTLHTDCRINTYPYQHAAWHYEKIVLRILQRHSSLLNYQQLGMPLHLLQTFKKYVHAPQGLILVTGPTGSGKTHTLYAALEDLRHSKKNITSIEDPIEIPLPGIFQTATKPEVGFDFAQALRGVLRQDPDVIMIGEIRDAETAQIAVQAAQTGHIVLATLHSNSACQSIARMLHLGVPAYQLADCLLTVIAQRLLRCICPYCHPQQTHAIPANKPSTKPSSKSSGKSSGKPSSQSSSPSSGNLPSHKTIYPPEEPSCNPSSLPYHQPTCTQTQPAAYLPLPTSPRTTEKKDHCIHCNNGWKERTAIFELLENTAPVGQAILNKKSSAEIQMIAQQHGFKKLNWHAQQLKQHGVTTQAEIQRVLG